MIDPQVLSRLRDVLVSSAGGYLRNPIRETGVTCSICATPLTPGWTRCGPCERHLGAGLGRTADAVAPLVYAVEGRQSHYVMRGYKAHPPVEEHRTVVALLCLLALQTHTTCTGRIVGAPVTHWSTVPSLPARPGEHPLRRIVATAAYGSEVPIVATDRVTHPRSMRTDHFRAGATLARRSHVLLLDDTWVGGGHAQSAVLALRTAGAAFVSVLVVARYLKEGFGDNARFIRERLTRDYDPQICPWTGGACP